MEIERRRPPRLQPADPIPVEYPHLKASIRDISGDGAYIADKRPLAIGRIVEFNLRIADSPIDIRAIVRRSEPGTGMAVEFIEMSNSARDQLRRFLAAHGVNQS